MTYANFDFFLFRLAGRVVKRNCANEMPHALLASFAVACWVLAHPGLAQPFRWTTHLPLGGRQLTCLKRRGDGAFKLPFAMGTLNSAWGRGMLGEGKQFPKCTLLASTSARVR